MLGRDNNIYIACDKGQVMKIDTKKTPLKITYGGSLLAGSGVGASAASCVSLARALDDEFDLGLSMEVPGAAHE